MKKVERLVHAGGPWLFGMASIVSSLLIAATSDRYLEMAIFMGSGFICLSLYSTNSLLIKLLQAKGGKDDSGEG